MNDKMNDKMIKRVYIHVPWIDKPKEPINDWNHKMRILTRDAKKTNNKLYYGYLALDEDWESHYPNPILHDIFDALIVNKDRILNPLPGLLKSTWIKWVPFSHNQLLIIDGAYHAGSIKNFECANKSYCRALDQLNFGEYCYAEIAGRLVIKNNQIDNIVIHSNHEITYPDDSGIIFSINDNEFANSEYIFHTHPEPSKERRLSGIVYEFPSGNDLVNFAKYYKPNVNKTIGSILISPEGVYLIRPLIYFKHINLDVSAINIINDKLIELEGEAFRKYQIIDDSTFNDFTFIDKLNKYLYSWNIRIDYFPRNNGLLQSFYLPKV